MALGIRIPRRRLASNIELDFKICYELASRSSVFAPYYGQERLELFLSELCCSCLFAEAKSYRASSGIAAALIPR